MSKIVIDNDCGIDDAWALNILLNSAKNLNILGITCVNGNTTVENVCKNNLYFLKTAGRTEIPVYIGAERQIIPTNEFRVAQSFQNFHGKDGFGDVSLPELSDLPKKAEQNAVAFLNDVVCKNKGEVSIICCGPLTNIALAVRTYSSFKENVKELFIMGGNHTAMGNITMAAEFNFHSDPEAAYIVLSEFTNKIILLPWETCINVKVPFAWREDLAKCNGKLMSLINKIEEPILIRSRNLGFNHWISADQLLAALFVNRDLVKDSENVYATVELSGSFTRGQVVIDHLRVHKHNVLLIKEIDTDLYKDMLTKLKQY